MTDSGAQQWLETLEKALRGCTAYLRAALPRVMHLPGCARDWARLMHVLTALVAMEGLPAEGGSRRVRVLLCQLRARSLVVRVWWCSVLQAAIGLRVAHGFGHSGPCNRAATPCLHRSQACAACRLSTDVAAPCLQVALASLAMFSSAVAPHVESAACPPFIWHAAWGALRAAAPRLVRPATAAHASVRVRFVQTLAAVYRGAPSKFAPPAQYAALLADLAALAQAPVATGEPWPHGYLPPVQSAVLASLNTLAPPLVPLGWEVLVDFACDQIAAACAQEQPLAGFQGTAAVAADAGAQAASPQLSGSAAACEEVGSGEALSPQALANRRLWAAEVASAAVRMAEEQMPAIARAAAVPQLAAAMQAPLRARAVDAEAQALGEHLAQCLCRLLQAVLPPRGDSNAEAAGKDMSEVRSSSHMLQYACSWHPR